QREEDRRRNQIREKSLALVAIKAGGDEHINLPRHDRKRQEGRPEHRKLQLCDEIFEQRGVDELGIFRPRDPYERPDQNIVDILGEHEADREHHAERDQRLDQPRTQLDQVIHQGRLARLDIFVCHPPPPACLGGGTSAGAKSFSLTGDGGSGNSTFTSCASCCCCCCSCCGSGKAGTSGAASVDGSLAAPTS